MASNAPTKRKSSISKAPSSVSAPSRGESNRKTSNHTADEDEEEEQCPICFDDLKGQGKHRLLRSSAEGVVMLNCGHRFCQTCIRTYVATAINDGQTKSGK